MSIERAAAVPHPPIIIPEVGRGEERKISATISAYEDAMKFLAEIEPETVIISTPHSAVYKDYLHISPGKGARGNFASFHAPQVEIEASYDTELVQTIEDMAIKRDFPAGTLGESDKTLDHGTMIPLFFLNKFYRDYRIVRIGLSYRSLADHYAMGQLIQKAVNKLGRKAVYIASGDLSHKLLREGPYGFAKEGPQYDEAIMDILGNGDFSKLLDFNQNFLEKAAECGHRSFTIMAGAFDGMSVKCKSLSHEGTFGVGYGVAEIEALGEDPDRCLLDKWEKKEKERIRQKYEFEDPYVRIARYTIEKLTKENHIPDLKEIKEVICKNHHLANEDLNELFNRRAASFVTINKDDRLRGCIGTIVPTTSCLAEEIINNAVSASTQDPRFPKIEKKELDFLSISVDVLGEIEEVHSLDMLDPKRYGVIVSKGYRRGLLLPNLEGVDTVEKQIRIAASKANLWPKDKHLKLERFQVVRHE